jgi:hypothetical protein
MSKFVYQIGYGRGEIEPRIAPLVDALVRAGFETFSSCEGHAEDAGSDNSVPRFANVAFYACEQDAKRVHEVYLRYRDRLGPVRA